MSLRSEGDENTPSGRFWEQDSLDPHTGERAEFIFDAISVKKGGAVDGFLDVAELQRFSSETFTGRQPFPYYNFLRPVAP